ncbi:succinylglutamate desuccinylase/aspartoacylase family protein [Pseudoalteromonas sp. DL2-H2.2]|uniref:succinylglutamate desuccinylase/aspartoacylase family protein n=1 Tax=Pseudoalteromonas sp. DL2-H2.2 TaxID=2908889 RepID=UPI001F1E16B2|nr:succinylglutamate desuccinylase/aspartoacylase family protein [Pseudoalteromonas sp. DL2-H2.2]MCF2910724.1 succinylglutamate desuccinylase/aspartoacylase family protein [Pseudoalteromonas sp. DL2-H2.2]
MAKAKKNQVFTLLNTPIEVAERKTLSLEVAKLYTHSPLTIPIEVVNGAEAGPVVMVCAAIHGDELNGVEIVRQLLAKVDPKALRGTLIAVPVVNVFGFIHKSRYLPDRRDLNRCFPGSERGSLAARVANVFFKRVASKCTHIIDLHTGAIHRSNLPQIRANLKCEATADIAKAFGTPVVIDATLRNGSLRSEASNLGIPVITYEAGEALRFDPLGIAAGLKGVENVLRRLKVLKGRRSKKVPEPVIADSTSWVRAHTDGIVRAMVGLGERVNKEQVLGYISNPLGGNEVAIQAPRSGIIIGQQSLPLVNEGDAVFHIAYFAHANTIVEQQLGEFIDELDLDEQPVDTELNN